MGKYGLYEHHVASTQQGKTPRPKISVGRKYLYFVFHLPYQPKNSNKFYICDLNVFLTDDTLITIESQGNIPALMDYFKGASDSRRIKDRRFKQGSYNLFLNLMKYLLNDIERIIDKQGELVDSMNKEIFKTTRAPEFIETISVLRYNQIVAFSVMERQSRMMEFHLGEKNPLLKFSASSTPKWNSVVEAFQTLAYELNADIGHLEGLVKTFETLVTHRTNQTIKILTIFSVVLLPLTLISGIFGMNFSYIPLAEHPYGFFISLVGMFLLLLGMLAYFRWRKWL